MEHLLEGELDALPVALICTQTHAAGRALMGYDVVRPAPLFLRERHLTPEAKLARCESRIAALLTVRLRKIAMDEPDPWSPDSLLTSRDTRRWLQGPHT